MPGQQPACEILAIVDDHVVRGPQAQYMVDEFLHSAAPAHHPTLPRGIKPFLAPLDDVDTRVVGRIYVITPRHHDVAVSALLGD